MDEEQQERNIRCALELLFTVAILAGGKEEPSDTQTATINITERFISRHKSTLSDLAKKLAQK